MFCSLDRGLGYTGVCIYQNSAKIHLIYVRSILCKFYIKMHAKVFEEVVVMSATFFKWVETRMN